MSLNYAFTENWNNSIKELVRTWVREKLTVVQDDGTVEAPEDLFLEYIIVMVSNGKQMQELSQQLRDFIGDENADEFASDLGIYLQTLSSPSSADVPLNKNKIEQVQPRLSSVVSVKAVSTTNDDQLDNGSKIDKRDSRQSARNISRLLDNALRLTTAPHKHREPQKGFTTQALRQSAQSQSQGNTLSEGFSTRKGGGSSSATIHRNQERMPSEISVPSVGLSTKRGLSNLNQETAPSQRNVSSSGLSTKKADTNSSSANSNESKEEGDSGKRRKIILGGKA